MYVDSAKRNKVITLISCQQLLGLQLRITFVPFKEPLRFQESVTWIDVVWEVLERYYTFIICDIYCVIAVAKNYRDAARGPGTVPYTGQ